MPSMGVGTSDADGDVGKVLRSPMCSPSLTPSQAAMTLQRWFRQVRAGQQARRLLALLALMSASQQANNNNGSVCAARALPDVCVMCCVLDSVEDYAAAVDVENYTRRLLCEENLPATNEAWRQASSSVRRQLRQKHPRLRRICLLPARETSDLVAELIVQLSVPRETHKEDEDDFDTGTPSWIDVDARMHTLLGETATDWLAAQPVPSKHTVKTSDVHNALQAWVEWRTHRQSHSSYENEAVVEDAALLRDVPPLPPPHRRSPSADATAEADVNSRDMLLPPRPLRGEQSRITAADDAAEQQEEEREVEEWLHDESDGNDDDDDEVLQSTDAEDLATRLAAADEAALHRRNTRFYAAQKAKEAALSKVLAHRLGLERSVGAEVRPSKDDDGSAHDSAPGDAVLPIFGRGADQIRSPCLGSACVTDLRSSPPHTVSCVCAVCELDGVWADAAEAEDALVRCAACGIPLHQTCAVTSKQARESLCYCETSCSCVYVSVAGELSVDASAHPPRHASPSMTDVLTVLHSLMHRVSSVLMPSELSDVLQFLRGNHWRLVENGAQTVTPTSTATATNAASATSASSPTRKQSRYVPDGRVAHHGFIPLAIAADALLSLASGGERAALEQLFSRHGFERVVAVNLCPSGMASRADGASVGGSAFGEVGRGVESVGHDGAAASAATTLNSIRPGQRRRRGQREGETVWQTIEAENTTAGRLTCVDIIRTWLAEVEEEARRGERQRHVSRRRNVDRAHIRTQDLDAPQRTETRAIGCDADDADSTRRLLLLVRCTADNRELAVSTASSSAGAGSARFGPSRSARRLTERADPLFLLLHDLAAAQTLSQVRLTHIGGAATAHIAVLLLPDDHIYGGILLQQRLRRELAYRYVTRLFEDSDDLSITARPADRPSSTTTSATTGGEKKSSDENGVSLRLSTRWARTGRLLDLWEPGWAARLATSAGTPDTDLTSVVNDAVSEVPGAGCVTDAMLERHLLRRCGDGAFFLRPSNLPLCAFLREALLRFPLLLRPAHLQLLQAAWTSRHALVDVMWVFHALQMPFDFTTGADANSGAAPVPSSDARAPVRTTSSPSAFATCRQRTSFSDVYRDTTCLLDALLEVAATLRTRGANGQGRAATAAATGVAGGEEASAAAALDEAVAFMLLVDEVSRQQSYIHVLQAAPITKALAEIYRREVHAWATRRAEASVLPHTADSARIQAVKALEAPFLALSEGEQARHTLLYQLPFHQPSPLCGGSHGHTIADDAPRWPVRLPAVMRVTGVRLSVAGALQSAALSAALAPDASLRELVELAGGLVKAVSPHNFYSPLIPSTVRVLHVLAVHALRASLEREKHVPLAQLQHVCQLSDDVLLVTLHELQSVGFIAVNSFRQTARSLLSG